MRQGEDRFRRIREAVAANPVGFYRRHIAGESRKVGSRRVFRCPLHEDSKPSFNVYPDGRFCCFGCQARGDAVDFYERLKGCDTMTAVEGLERELGLGDERPATRSSQRPASLLPAGEAGETPAPRGGGNSRTRAWRVCDANGNCQAVHERTDHADGTKGFRWLSAQGAVGLGGKAMNDLPLYGSEKVRDAPLVLVVEGEQCADYLWELGWPAVATFGAGTTPTTAAVAALCDKEVVLWPDDDKVGREHMQRVGEALLAVAAAVRVVPSAGESHTDVCDLIAPAQAEQIKDLLAEMTEPLEPGGAAEGVAPAEAMKFSPVRRLDEVLNATTWLWPSWIPRGYLTILAGEPGCGKSGMALWLAHCALSGLPWPDGTENSEPIERVLWLETDDCHGALRDRCKQWGVDTEKILLLGEDGLFHVDLGHRGMLKRLAAGIREHNCGMVIIDTLAGAHCEDENSAAIRMMISQLAKLAQTLDVPVVAVHHLRKRGMAEGGEASMDRVRGSSAIIAGARSIIGLDRQANPLEARPTGRAIVLKANLCPPPSGLTFQHESGGLVFSPLRETVQRAHAGLTVERALGAVVTEELSSGPKGRQHLLAAVVAAGLSPRTFEDVVKRMQVVGWKVGRNKWYARPDDPQAPQTATFAPAPPTGIAVTDVSAVTEAA